MAPNDEDAPSASVSSTDRSKTGLFATLSPGDGVRVLNRDHLVTETNVVRRSGATTREWTIIDKARREGCLLYEDDTKWGSGWYYSTELEYPNLTAPSLPRSGTDTIWRLMSRRETPPEYLVRGTTKYRFESADEGTVETASGQTGRLTWDYWTPDRSWNLALESWADGTTAAYLTQPISTPKAKTIVKSDFPDQTVRRASSDPTGTAYAVQKFIAQALMVVGGVLVLRGCD